MLGALLLLQSALSAQTPSTADPTVQFSVASVKPSSNTSAPATVSNSPSGLYTVTNMPLRTLIRNAFGLQLDDQLAGGPEWVNSAKFDISARAESARPTVEHRRLMLQALLAERFRLSMHRETRELPIHALEMSRYDRKFGLRLRRPEVDCDVLARQMQRGEISPQPAGKPLLAGMRMQAGKLESACMPLRVLVSTLTSSLSRTVVDHTGLEGNFTLELEWEVRPNPDGRLPSIFAALQEQLGLKLENL